MKNIVANFISRITVLALVTVLIQNTGDAIAGGTGQSKHKQTAAECPIMLDEEDHDVQHKMKVPVWAPTGNVKSGVFILPSENPEFFLEKSSGRNSKRLYLQNRNMRI